MMVGTDCPTTAFVTLQTIELGVDKIADQLWLAYNFLVLGNVFLGGTKMASKKPGKITLIASDSKNPIGTAKKGTKLQVVSVQLAGSAGQKRPTIGARLCGGSGTCIAVHEV